MKELKNIQIGLQQGFFDALEDGIIAGFEQDKKFRSQAIPLADLSKDQAAIYNSFKAVLSRLLNVGETLQNTLIQITKDQHAGWERMLIRLMKDDVPVTRIVYIKNLLQPQKDAYESLKAVVNTLILSK